jgi:hypothetical protein
MPVITSTSVRLHNEFIRILFLQTHRETDRFFAASGVMSSQSDRGFFHYRHATFCVVGASLVFGLVRGSGAFVRCFRHLF